MNKNKFIKPLNSLYNEKGGISKFLRVGKNIKKIEEIYFSEVKFKKIKCWKKHIENNLRIYVVSGKIRFVIYKNNKFYRIDITELSNKYLYIPKNTIFGFQGLKKNNQLLCVLEIKHNDKEVINFDKIEYNYDNWIV